MAGINGEPLAPIYSMTKNSLRAFTKSLASTYGEQQGIRVNSIHPGNVRSGLINEEILGEEGLAEMESKVPVSRLGEPEEIDHAIIFMIENTFFTGAEVVVDGGFTFNN